MARRLADAEQYRTAVAAQRAADFRNGILVGLHAAEEPDPFASIRGDFDLSGSDNRQWKTSLQLPDAEKCALLKTVAATPTAASAWTFACMFRASGDGYERMVKSVQSVLNLPFQPDERPVNINQVFFADPSKPAWRFFVAKMKDGTVGLSAVAVRFAGVPATAANTTPFPAVPPCCQTRQSAGKWFAPVKRAQRARAMLSVRNINNGKENECRTTRKSAVWLLSLKICKRATRRP